MKKTYQAPRVEVNEINATQMICESFGMKGEVSGSEAGFEKASRDRGDYEPADETDNFGDLW